MQERYLIDDIMYLCTHDLLAAIAEYSSMNKVGTLINIANSLLSVQEQRRKNYT